MDYTAGVPLERSHTTGSTGGGLRPPPLEYPWRWATLRLLDRISHRMPATLPIPPPPIPVPYPSQSQS
nr:hypothetical protein BaRGS_008467 [Batillaria attramentaria]